MPRVSYGQVFASKELRPDLGGGDISFRILVTPRRLATPSLHTHSELYEVSGAVVDGEEGVSVTEMIHTVTTHSEGQAYCVTAVRVHHLHLQELNVFVLSM
ncbi:hypothetical protein E2C01_039505 [Portunus trituberculatus]|uniref:Uncharacterized protein n=1 Tax=Portunus trituberculatus TaxID=210409 RepID=A0A5B7FDU0_PORTR|nr:hypothetical protein [Portunus trituberculatus]